MTPEQKARERIDFLLTQAGWDVQDSKEMNISAKPGVAVREGTSLRYAAPHLRRGLRAALTRAKERLAHARVDGIDWYWPAAERLPREWEDDAVRLLSPFDPIVWDRGRFEILWGWAYRFEAYTPSAKRKLGYYALPLLWRRRVIGWGNVSVNDGALRAELGYVDAKPPSDRTFARELDAELDRMRVFLRLA